MTPVERIEALLHAQPTLRHALPRTGGTRTGASWPTTSSPSSSSSSLSRPTSGTARGLARDVALVRAGLRRATLVDSLGPLGGGLEGMDDDDDDDSGGRGAASATSTWGSTGDAAAHRREPEVADEAEGWHTVVVSRRSKAKAITTSRRGHGRPRDGGATGRDPAGTQTDSRPKPAARALPSSSSASASPPPAPVARLAALCAWIAAVNRISSDEGGARRDAVRGHGERGHGDHDDEDEDDEDGGRHRSQRRHRRRQRRDTLAVFRHARSGGVFVVNVARVREGAKAATSTAAPRTLFGRVPTPPQSAEASFNAGIAPQHAEARQEDVEETGNERGPLAYVYVGRRRRKSETARLVEASAERGRVHSRRAPRTLRSTIRAMASALAPRAQRPKPPRRTGEGRGAETDADADGPATVPPPLLVEVDDGSALNGVGLSGWLLDYDVVYHLERERDDKSDDNDDDDDDDDDDGGGGGGSGGGRNGVRARGLADEATATDARALQGWLRAAAGGDVGRRKEARRDDSSDDGAGGNDLSDRRLWLVQAFAHEAAVPPPPPRARFVGPGAGHGGERAPGRGGVAHRRGGAAAAAGTTSTEDDDGAVRVAGTVANTTKITTTKEEEEEDEAKGATDAAATRPAFAFSVPVDLLDALLERREDGCPEASEPDRLETGGQQDEGHGRAGEVRQAKQRLARRVLERLERRRHSALRPTLSAWPGRADSKGGRGRGDDDDDDDDDDAEDAPLGGGERGTGECAEGDEATRAWLEALRFEVHAHEVCLPLVAL